MEEKNQQDLFLTLQKGQQKLQNIKELAYVVLGSQKSGTSALCNAILRNPIIGQANPFDQSQVYYVPFNLQDQNTAPMTYQFDFTTHIPNVWTFQKDSTIIDMPGFGTRNAWQSFTSYYYFMTSCFKRLRKVKFLLTISQAQILSKNVFEAINPFMQFINLFDFGEVSSEMRQKLYRSILVVVSHAKKTKQYYLYKIKEIIKHLKTSKNLLQLKQCSWLLQLLQCVADRMGVEVFQYAEVAKLPDNSHLLKSLNGERLEFFQVADFQQKHVFRLENRLVNLSHEQDKELENYLKCKVGNITNCLQILTDSIQLIMKRWDLCLQQVQKNSLQIQSWIISLTIEYS